MSYKVPDDLLYTEEHEWVRRHEDGALRIGITEYAQDELGEVVFVELPEVGQTFEAQEEVGSIESVKAVAEVYTPITGEVVAVNGSLEDAPEKVNDDPFGDGWLFELRTADASMLDSLMSPDKYQEYIGSL